MQETNSIVTELIVSINWNNEVYANSLLCLSKRNAIMNFCISVLLEEWKYLGPNKRSTAIEADAENDLLEGFKKNQREEYFQYKTVRS